jgi:AraC family transcriptional regulator, regulatory protein of adaptative response / DNA-3-methyladenine glycosylase II
MEATAASISEYRLATVGDVELNPEVCWQAIRSRDRRFDGRLYAAAVTSGVYCRPTCPVQFAKENHTVFFSSAVAAEKAGFRPCRRCHSGAPPGSPAWLGTSAVVSRALRLIGEGALFDSGVPELAERLGIGARQLRRLFIEHVGMPPVKVGSLYRLHYAQTLIEQTNMPIAEIALAAGFKSIRQFNHAARIIWARPPSHWRRNGVLRLNPSPRNQARRRAFCLPPFDRSALFAMLADWKVARSIVGGTGSDAG